MIKFKIHPYDVVDVTAWCIETFGPSYTMPSWWSIDRQSDQFEIPLRYEIKFLKEADAALYTLRWK